ncbi:CDP-diacylglycerol--inositol 3-phosphatidyltransferase isoform X2 [Diachasma alloeum]|uniref:CDP-diacylglycerol--inositol 3-phosphatidyltransferase isoform X2 n=1 Tax=Diachasma alloeum TaxID=454923 RepID=UPI0007384805|nr:CDP-diacylglycerol--inositol 3-phosphatidyltransferase isoform X2 [Diachasma alloeum]
MTETENVFIFVPNLIGFARVVLAIISFYYMPTHHVVAIWCYVTSALLDAVDGHAARYFNQSTKFGAMLDQLTDRVGTMCLLVNLSMFYPAYAFWFQTILQGKTSHKFIDMSGNPIMRVYYTNKLVLFVMCAGNEAFYAALYLLHFTEGPTLLGMSLFRAVMYISAPIAIVKTAISVIHGYVASLNLSTIDVKEREALRKAK